jgi:deoxyribodipyrimidine photo-lyase
MTLGDGAADLFDAAGFEPTLAAARARVAAVRPAAYARTRNHLDGAVTRLSPYITHGFLSLPEVLAAVLARGPLDIQHKFVYELAWREYFAHVHAHLGDGILQSLHPGVLPDSAYAPELPLDILGARTGVPAIDEAVSELLCTGWLHNHARMWLASYVVHLRKVHWRAGADWMFGHLLDGDLASNHLSWQWVAGTGSHKPYLFNAENVARYAPAHWHSPSTVIDQSYEALDRMARSPGAVKGGSRPHDATRSLPHTLPAGWQRVDGPVLCGQRVELIHAWSLGDRPATAPGVLRLGVWVVPGPAGLHWSAKRWAFVMPRMQALCDLMWAGTADEWAQALRQADSVDGTFDLHLPTQWVEWGLRSAPRCFALPPRRCNSFSQYWTQVTKGRKQAGELLQAS